MLQSFLPKPILIDTQVSCHYFSTSIPHAFNKKAPSGTQSSNKEVSFSSHQEIYKGMVCAGFSTKTCFIFCHCYVSHLTWHVCVVEIPMGILFCFINNFLKVIRSLTFKIKIVYWKDKLKYYI